MNEIRVLAIDPTQRGFGFAVYEGLWLLVDWGVHQAREDKRQESLQELERLFEFYEPDVFVVEDCSAKRSRRGERAEDLIEEARELAAARDVEVCSYGPAQVRETFEHLGAEPKNKFKVGSALALLYPPLAPYLPPKRKLHESERERQAIFDAAALALTFLLAGKMEVRRAAA